MEDVQIKLVLPNDLVSEVLANEEVGCKKEHSKVKIRYTLNQDSTCGAEQSWRFL